LVNKIDQKSVDFGTQGLEAPTALSQDEVDKARVVAAQFANDANELRLFLDMMGILPESIKPEPATTVKREKRKRAKARMTAEQIEKHNKRRMLRNRRNRLMEKAKQLGGYTQEQYRTLHALEDELGYDRTTNVRVFRQFDIDRMEREKKEEQLKKTRKRRRMERVRYALANGGITREGNKLNVTPQLLRELYEWENDPNRKRYIRRDVA
jgi:hypothetical protein